MLYQSEKNHIVVDVTKPPYNADNTGREDCTDALCRALDDILAREIEGVWKIREKLLNDPRDNFRIGFENRKENGVPTVVFPEDPPAARILYFPKGTYLISDTVTYSFENLKSRINDRPSSDVNRFIHFKGEDEGTTVIKLADGLRAFRYGEEKPMVSFVRSNGSNINMMNTFEDLTLDAGKNNPGAVGLRFHSANTGAIRNVTIRSSDEGHRGYCALLMDFTQENITENLTIDGFEYGIRSTGDIHSRVFENVKMDNILTAAVVSSMGITGLRNAVIRTYGEGISSGKEALTTAVNCELIHLGDRFGTAVSTACAHTYLRNVKCENFGCDVRNGHEAVIAGDREIREYNSDEREYRLFPCRETTIELPVKAQPVYEWNGDRRIVAEVDDFGAVGDGVTDSTEAIRRAMKSGKEYIVFGEGRYLVSGEIEIPASVRAVNFMYCDFALTEDFLEEKEKGLFVIAEDSDDILFLDDAFVFEKFYGYLRFIRHSAKRDLAVSDVHVQTGAFYFNTVGGQTLWFDNVASTMGVFGGIGWGATPCFTFRDGQTVFCRQFNPERSAHNCLCENNITIWIYGFKTEGPAGRGFTFRDGCTAEVICGDATIAEDDGTPCIENRDSSVFAYLRTSGCNIKHQFVVAVQEIQRGVERVFKAFEMPKYGIQYYFIPGYIGMKR